MIDKSKLQVGQVVFHQHRGRGVYSEAAAELERQHESCPDSVFILFDQSHSGEEEEVSVSLLSIDPEAENKLKEVKGSFVVTGQVVRKKPNYASGD